jgi:hypothetical protein
MDSGNLGVVVGITLVVVRNPNPWPLFEAVYPEKSFVKQNIASIL